MNVLNDHSEVYELCHIQCKYFDSFLNIFMFGFYDFPARNSLIPLKSSLQYNVFSWGFDHFDISLLLNFTILMANHEVLLILQRFILITFQSILQNIKQNKNNNNNKNKNNNNDQTLRTASDKPRGQQSGHREKKFWILLNFQLLNYFWHEKLRILTFLSLYC